MNVNVPCTERARKPGQLGYDAIGTCVLARGHQSPHQFRCPAFDRLSGARCAKALDHAGACRFSSEIEDVVEDIATKTSDDPVNHPRHYTSHPSGVECIDVVEHMTFNVGSAIKYLWRAGLKDSAPELQDLEKARWYIDREIQRLKKVPK